MSSDNDKTISNSSLSLKSNSKPMTREEVLQKILADQKFIREARQQGISFEELRKKYGYLFATV